MHHVKQLINGQFVDSNTSEWIDITDPATQEVIAKVPQTTDDEINQAVAAAQAAFQTSAQNAHYYTCPYLFKVSSIDTRPYGRAGRNTDGRAGQNHC